MKKDRLCIVWSATNRSDWNLYLPVYLWIGTVVNLKIGFFFHVVLHCKDRPKYYRAVPRSIEVATVTSHKI